jgi:hypothetical protein
MRRASYFNLLRFNPSAEVRPLHQFEQFAVTRAPRASPPSIEVDSVGAFAVRISEESQIYDRSWKAFS